MKEIAVMTPVKDQKPNQQYSQNAKSNSNRSASELFSSISNRIRILSNNTISETESREAARRFISFCQLLVDYKLKQSMQRKNSVKQKNKSVQSLAALKTN